MKILISGFEPFDNSFVNPSQLLVEYIKKDKSEFINFDTCLLPVDTSAAPKKLIDAIDKVQPNFVISLGQAYGRAVVSVEKIAINFLNFRIPDNSNIKIEDQLIIPDAPAAYFSSLPVREIQGAVSAVGIPCEISYSAGTYLCNQVFFCIMHHITINHLDIKAGFVHFPALPEQVAGKHPCVPSMDIDVMQKALDQIIRVIRPSFF